MTETTDQEILGFFRAGREEYAFEILVKNYQQKLYYHIRRMVPSHDDADDVLQNTFIKIWGGLKNFREEAHLYTWLYRIATNEALSFLRQKKQANSTSLDSIEHQLSKNLESDHYFSGDEIQLQLQKAILTLPEKQRIVFNMRYYDETPYAEMAEILETSEGALKASYHIAAKKVEEYLVSH